MCDLSCSWFIVRFFFPKTNSKTKDTKDTKDKNYLNYSKHLSPIEEELSLKDEDSHNHYHDDVNDDVYAFSDEDYLVNVTFRSSVKKT
jgi:hypothetical protein